MFGQDDADDDLFAGSGGLFGKTGGLFDAPKGGGLIAIKILFSDGNSDQTR